MDNQSTQQPHARSGYDSFAGPMMGPMAGAMGDPGYGYGYATTPAIFEQPYSITDWTSYYIPTVQGARRKRPVIYVAAPLPAGAASSFGGFPGGFGGATGGLPFGF